MDTTINERFNSLIESLKTNPGAFAKSINKSYTAIENTLKGRTKPGFDLLEAVFATYPQVNTDWLVNGKGEMFRLNAKPADGGAFGEIILNEIRTLREQLTVKDQQIAGLQRTVDALVGKSEGATNNPLSFDEFKVEVMYHYYTQRVRRNLIEAPVQTHRLATLD